MRAEPYGREIRKRKKPRAVKKTKPSKTARRLPKAPVRNLVDPGQLAVEIDQNRNYFVSSTKIIDASKRERTAMLIRRSFTRMYGKS